MNSYLTRFVHNQLDNAANFVCGHMPIDLPPQEVYEGLFSGVPHGAAILHDFRAAGQHLMPGVFAKRVPVLMDGQVLSFMVRLPPTDEYSTYFIPVEGFAINSESKLAQALKLPLQITRQWTMLVEAFDRLADVTDAQQIAMLMPWLREMVDQNTANAIGGLKRERVKIDKDIKAITQGNAPNRFPRLTSELNQVCLSGRMLLTQARLLETTRNETDVVLPPVAIARTSNLLPAWFNKHLEEVTEDWVNAANFR